MKTSTSQGKHGIQWTSQNQLEDLNFTDDISLLSYTHQQIQMKTTSVSEASASVGFQQSVAEQDERFSRRLTSKSTGWIP
ncbi:unnamed protein product [Schistosoma curassoni]|uniref:Reverse transcriptase domain-containing protein n=1 Tax=Schistosoma curassoni TaxID=6186 RepID=A0A183KUQ6_9TREM|nr:unnamed protein product [Schistosoma curassoni]